MSGRRLLAIDTSGTNALVALGEADGALVAERRWARGLPPRRGAADADRRAAAPRHGVPLAELGGIVVGTGPGAFTGLRVGLATAKALAHGLGIPIAGVATSEALLGRGRRRRDGGDAGRPSCCRPDLPTESSSSPERRRWSRAARSRSSDRGHRPRRGRPAGPGPGRGARPRGRRRRPGFRPRCSGSAPRRLAAGGDDVARLVPEYVTLPRGVAGREGGGAMVARPPVAVVVERMTVDDLDAVHDIERESFTHPLAAARLPPGAGEQPPGPLHRGPLRRRRSSASRGCGCSWTRPT